MREKKTPYKTGFCANRLHTACPVVVRNGSKADKPETTCKCECHRDR